MKNLYIIQTYIRYIETRYLDIKHIETDIRYIETPSSHLSHARISISLFSQPLPGFSKGERRTFY